ncbi:HAD-IA family hydrolase [Desulfoscipio gibsoniae]
MTKHVIFDFDGTIVESRYLAVELLNELAPKYKLRKIKESEYEHLRSLSIPQRCQAINLPFYKLPILKMDLTKKYRRATASLQAIDGIKEVLGKLKAGGMTLSILSSNSTENINAFLAHNNINFFDYIISSGGLFGKDKAIKSFLTKHRLNNKDVIYVGDECRDICACQKNKVRIIAVTWGYDAEELLAGCHPDALIRNPLELYNIVLNMT